MMKCENCKAKLSPLTLKQVDRDGKNLRFELECHACGFRNVVSKKMYFKIRKDFAPLRKIEPINNKLPSEMNVIFVSLQRCGISWIIYALSDHHEFLFGEPIPYEKENAEISKVIATRTRFPLPQRWNCVYEADPKQLVKRGYDRIVIVERDLEELKVAQQIYFQEDLTWMQRETLIRKIEEAWHLVYESGVDDPRVMKVHLDDLNNYTRQTMNKLMDFLNFPKVGRAPVLPIAVYRQWEVYSSMLEKEKGICNKLQGLEQIYKKNRFKKIFKDLEKVLIIGPLQLNGSHFSEQIFNVAKNKVETRYISPIELAPVNSLDLKYYDKRKTLYPLSKVLKKLDYEPDLILMDECRFSWLNDVNIPVFYHHREFKRPPTVFYPDVVFFWHQPFIDYFCKIFAPHWMARVPNHVILPIAVNPEMYLPQEKTIEGIIGIGARESLEEVISYMKELTNVSTLIIQKQELDTFKEMGFTFYPDPIDDEKYRELLPHCEMLWVPLPNRQYTTRRMLDCMATKTLCFIKIENEEHEQVLRDMDLHQGKHYIKFEQMEDLREIKDSITPEMVQEITENAYNLVIQKHTYEQRFEFIKELYQKFTEKITGDVYDYA